MKKFFSAVSGGTAEGDGVCWESGDTKDSKRNEEEITYDEFRNVVTHA